MLTACFVCMLLFLIFFVKGDKCDSNYWSILLKTIMLCYFNTCVSSG